MLSNPLTYKGFRLVLEGREDDIGLRICRLEYYYLNAWGILLFMNTVNK